jgi:hypothetical protein
VNGRPAGQMAVVAGQNSYVNFHGVFSGTAYIFATGPINYQLLVFFLIFFRSLHSPFSILHSPLIVHYHYPLLLSIIIIIIIIIIHCPLSIVHCPLSIVHYHYIIYQLSFIISYIRNGSFEEPHSNETC